MIKFTINGEAVETDVEADTPLLWVIRENLGMTGTKFGCGMSLCGACTVHLDGEPIRSCVTPVSAVAEQAVTTIEGLGANGLHVVQQAWIETNVPQCGYCQSGQLMSAAALIDSNANPSDKDIDTAMSGNVCRCGMYGRIRRAIHRAAELNAIPAPLQPAPTSPSEENEEATEDKPEQGVVRIFDPNALVVPEEMS